MSKTNPAPAKQETSSHYLYQGSKVRAMPAANMVSNRRLTTGTYEVQWNQDEGFYLQKIDDMVVPPEIYGDTAEFAQRVIKTYLDRGCNTGVLLEGEQGSGKTMLAKLVSSAMRDIDMPTLVINAPYVGPAFNAFMAAIDTPCMVFFDEFEKNYAKQEHRDGILTFFDGVFDSNKLIICTVNDKSRMSTHMLNRPGRLYYAMSYNRLSLQVIEEYCQKKLLNKDYVAAVKQVTTLYGGFNFDMLKALVEEMNRFNCTPKEALKFLNIRPSYTKFRTGTVFVPFGYNESTKKIIACNTSAVPPGPDSGVSLKIKPYAPEGSGITTVKNIVDNNVVDRPSLVDLVAQIIASSDDSNNRWGETVYVTADDLLAYDGDTGSQTFETDGFSIKFVPMAEAAFKEVVTEAQIKAEAIKSEVAVPSLGKSKLPSLKTPF